MLISMQFYFIKNGYEILFDYNIFKQFLYRLSYSRMCSLDWNLKNVISFEKMSLIYIMQMIQHFFTIFIHKKEEKTRKTWLHAVYSVSIDQIHLF